MRIDKVTAHAFGPLAGEVLALAPGLTVIVGANESAKSSWHAAMYAGLCGRKRGPGAVSLIDRRFAELHRPWDSDGWSASVVLTLDDGRRIEITQDLAGRIDSRAIDLDLARDVSAEIMHAGSPDGSRWLGLDRDSFLATACISQASMLEVLNSADDLQHYLARAAASTTADVTAARALELLDAFAKEHVGKATSNAVRPLRKAMDSLAAGKDAQQRAAAEHSEYLEVVDDAERARLTVQRMAHQVAQERLRETAAAALVDAARASEAARAEADRIRARVSESEQALGHEASRVDRVSELHSVFDGQAPESGVAADAVSESVIGALSAWAAAPGPPPLEGESAEELGRHLAELAEAPTGDIAIDPDVARAAAVLARSRERLAEHGSRRPLEREPLSDELAAASRTTPAVLRDLAADVASAVNLTSSTPEALAAMDREAAEAEEQAQAARSKASTAAARGHSRPSRSGSVLAGWLVGISGIVAIVAVGAAVMSQVVVGMVVAGIAIVLVGASLVARRKQRTRGVEHGVAVPVDETWALASEADRVAITLRERYRIAMAAAHGAASVRSEVEARCQAQGLPVDADRLRHLAAEVERARGEWADVEQWATVQAELVKSTGLAESTLRQDLAVRGIAGPAESVDDLLAEYDQACAERALVADAAGRRPALVQRLNERRAAETIHERAAALRTAAATAVIEAAAAAQVGALAFNALGGLNPGDDDSDEQRASRLVEPLEAWRRDRSAQLVDRDGALGGWQELQLLLGSSSPQELRAALAGMQRRHDDLVGEAQVREAAVLDTAARARECAMRAGYDPGCEITAGRAESAWSDARAAVEDALERLQQASGPAEAAEALRAERALRLASVSECDEAVAAAQRELDRVTTLANTIELTSVFMRTAQERVFRSIAPVLVAALDAWLPLITDGRYAESMVDAQSLAVSVRATGRPWRHASRLSVGTAEQIYLLLRMALAQHLATTGETCPLLLDDVTVQADPSRSVQILELLLIVAENRQIVLFAQDQVVAEWAERRLGEGPHAIVRLEQVAVV